MIYLVRFMNASRLLRENRGDFDKISKNISQDWRDAKNLIYSLRGI